MLVFGDLTTLNARRYPNKPALIMEGVELSYAELDARSNALAHALIARGVGSGDRVALLGFNSLEYAVILHAVAKCGALIVPVNFRNSAAELRHVIADSEPKLLFAEAEFAAVVAEARAGTATWPEVLRVGADHDGLPGSVALAAGRPRTPPAVRVDPQSSAVILYTSGTTGRPKGVLYAHATYFRMFMATAIEAHLAHEDVYLIAVPMFHAAGMNMALNQALFMGSTGVVHRGRFDPEVILALIARHRITTAILVPTQVGMLAGHPSLPRHDVTCLSRIFYGSMPMMPAVLQHALQVFPKSRFLQLYGSTECGMITALRHEDHERWWRSNGREALLSRFRVVDEQGNDVPVGGIGEVITDHARMGMIGYWRNEAATRETIRDGWMRSGDLARVEPEGFITLVDRIKEMINSGGENIYPKEIELVLATHPAVQEVAVFGIPDPHYGEAPCAAVAFKPGMSATAEELLALCEKQLARYKRPKKIEFHAALPRNASDKIQKQVLKAPHWAQPAG
ncbi:MAG: AMP-binding protein [Steroidobacteraceae bacterium]